MEKYIDQFTRNCSTNRLLQDIIDLDETMPFVVDNDNKTEALATLNEVKQTFDSQTLDHEQCRDLITRLGEVYRLTNLYTFTKEPLYSKLDRLERQITDDFNSGKVEQLVYDEVISQIVRLLTVVDNTSGWCETIYAFNDIEKINENLYNLYYKES